MIDETIRGIEERISASDRIDETRRRELLELVARLRGEVQELSRTNQQAAYDITARTEATVREATEGERNEDALGDLLHQMNDEVERFGVSHPRLAGVVTAIGQTLWRIGI
jgi:mevalonate kinase